MSNEIKKEDCVFFPEGDLICCMERSQQVFAEDPSGFGKSEDEAFEDFLENWGK